MNIKKLVTISALFTLLLAACNTDTTKPVVNDREDVSSESESNTKTPDKESENGEENSDSSTSDLKIALVAMEDNGKSGEAIGCGDSIVFVNKAVSENLTEEERIEKALEELFAIQDPFYGESGLYNGLTHSSNLAVDNIKMQGRIANVYLTGELISAGTCDDPRIKEQIISTIEENSEVTLTDKDVFINGESLYDYFDMRG